ncbi:DNA repair protein RecN [Pacificimonas sp. WHA3]|uniref:DNA repair protein RecN n=1 Tax=Pacificimonas pallii TaxID=2827236 RepID=A0ABS6SEG7_9SPHN|nr:DNA repair protein RecN [Pacificimonas pallii]MBV7256746.1 DNA repair protein RecN [Pacificimonas pallii]
MLTALTINDVLLIETLDLDFASGLTVLTGETGAGKSILLDSLGLTLGARADSGLVRAGQDRAQVSATFSAGPDHVSRRLLQAQDIDVGEDELVLRRVVKADGGSRAWVNDQPVSAALLRDIGSALTEIHGQHDERGLLDARGHRDLLDLYGGLDAPKEKVRSAHAALKTARKQLSELQARIARAAEDREWLDHAIDEIEAFGPVAGEETELAKERADMLAGQKIAEDLSTIDKELSGSKGALAGLRGVARRLERISDVHESLAEALGALDRALVETDDVETHLRRAAEEMAYDENRLDDAEERLFELRALARKHNVAPEALGDFLVSLTERRMALNEGDANLAILETELRDAEAAYVKAAAALTAARTTAAKGLDAAVAAELPPLKLDAAKFRTVISSLPRNAQGADGADEVQFEISTNPGSDFGALIKIASGGELSRFLLALKVALAASGDAGTMIFDEIDRGVGGATASAIGDRLARLAGDGQVLVVTHSPQVAARGDAHFRISKRQVDAGTRTSVVPLSAGERQEEIARMLSAAEVTEEARAQAARLLSGN